MGRTTHLHIPGTPQGRKKKQIEGFRIVDTLRKQYRNKAYQGSTVGLSSHQKLASAEISTLDTQQEYTGTQALKGTGWGMADLEGSEHASDFLSEACSL